MKQTIVVSYDRQWNDYVVKKLVNRTGPQIGSRLKKAEVDDLIEHSGAHVEIFGENRK